MPIESPEHPRRQRGWLIRRFSYGTTAAIVTSMGLIVGFHAAAASKETLVRGLLIVAIADNLTDSLSIHLYQESERLAPRAAFATTVSNFGARLAVSLSFVALVVTLPSNVAVVVSIVWGLVLLVGLTFVLARDRHVPVLPEIVKHVVIAGVVFLTSQAIGSWIH